MSRNNLTNSLLSEIKSEEETYLKSAPLHRAAKVNINHFAHHYLDFDLISADPYQEQGGLSDIRENAMVKSIIKQIDQANTKVIVGIFGSLHLPFLEKHLNQASTNKEYQLITINLSNVSHSDYEGEPLLRANALNLMSKIDLGQEMEAMTLDQYSL